MDWRQARDNTVRYWRRIQSSLDTLEEVELLQQINAVNDLCEKANEETEGGIDRCSYCLALQQFGGCLGISLQMSEAVVEGRRQDLAVLVERFLTQLESVTLPEGNTE